MKKICCVSDLHGYLPEIPDCDLLLLAGDYSPNVKTQIRWLSEIFAPWLSELRQRMDIIGVAGNHDTIFEQRPDLVPKLDWIYLQDSGTVWNGLKIWGTPWQAIFFDWGFNITESEMAQKWQLIPTDTDILILHGPPYMHGDYTPYGDTNAGSPSLLQRIQEVQPKLAIAGHFHSGYGRYRIGDTLMMNCTLVNEAYQPVFDVQEIFWPIDFDRELPQDVPS